MVGLRGTRQYERLFATPGSMLQSCDLKYPKGGRFVEERPLRLLTEPESGLEVKAVDFSLRLELIRLNAKFTARVNPPSITPSESAPLIYCGGSYMNLNS